MKRFRRRPLAAAIVVALSASDWALAQTQQPEQTLPEVRVRGAQESGFKTESTGSATRTDTPLRDIPQTINTVPQEVIRSQGATSLGDALRNVPGISYAAPEGGTQANFLYYLRGFPAGGDLFLDGVRDLGEYNRDLFNVEQVEVLKGPSSLTFGRGSTGGVIHQVSKTPSLWPINESTLTLGSNEKKRFTHDLNVKLGESHALRLNALWEDSGSYRYPQDVEKAGIAPSLRLGIGGGTDITLSYFFLHTKDVTDYGQPTLFSAGTGFFGLPPVSADKYYGYRNHDFTRHDTHIATVKLDQRISDSLSLRNTLRFARYEREMEATIPSLSATDANGSPITRFTPRELLRVQRNHDRGRTRDNDDQVLINQTELTWKAATGAVRHTVLGGLELAREQLDRRNYNLDANPATAVIDAPTSLTPLLDPDPSTQLSYSKSPNQRALAKADTFALYGQDQLELSRHWKALFGLRWEHYSASARNQDLTGNTPANTTGPFARTDDMLSSRAGLIWQPNASASYYVSYGNSYNPSGELGVYGATATNLSATNDDLEPEKNRNYEAGAQWDFAHGLRLRSAVFRNEKMNARMADPVLGTTVLAGRRRVDGVEAELAGEITRSWQVIASMALMHGEIVKGPANVEGKRPLEVPSRSASLWSIYRFAGGWEAGGGLFYASEKFLDDANTGQIPAYTVFDATAAYVQPKYEIRLNLFNVFDKLYYYGGYQNSPSRVLPARPREAELTLRYHWD